MSKIKVAIYDVDKEYRERFADYLMSYKSAEMELAVFSSQEFFCNALKEEKFQLLVLGNGYEDVIVSAKVQHVPVLVLTQGLHSYVQEEIALNDERISYTGKYQSMDEITKKMWVMAKANEEQNNSVLCSLGLEVVGVFSPVNHELQMLFSLLYAKNRARERNVLYVNLMEISGFSEIFGVTENDLGDIILSLREKDVTKESLLECIYEGDGFSYIGPLLSPEDIREVTAADVGDLLHAVEKYTDFEVVVLDISTSVNNLAEVFGACSKLYCIEKTGFLFETRARQFLNYLEKVTSSVFLEKIHRIIPPSMTRIICGGSNLLERLDWDELGHFVREQL